MKRGNGVLAFFRLSERFLLNWNAPPALPLHIQASFYSQLHLSSSDILSQNHEFLNTQKKLYFSSNPYSIVELIMTKKEWSEDLEKWLSNSHPTFSHEIVIYVLKCLEKNPQKAFDFFYWVTDKNGFNPSSIAYSLMLRILGNKECINQFWVFIKKLVVEGYDVDIRAYRAVFHNFMDLKMTSDAKALTKFVSKTTKESVTEGRVRNVVDLVLASDTKDDLNKNLVGLQFALSEDIILRIFWALSKLPLKALSFFCWLEDDMDYTHNGATYNGILRVLAKENSIHEFWSMVEEMKSRGHNIDIDTYLKVERQFENSGMLIDAVEFYGRMMDGPYEPPLDNCNWLLRDISFSETLDIELVFKVVKKYVAKGHHLSKTNYDWMYMCLIRIGNIEEAEKVLESMKHACLEPDGVTYSRGVLGFCKAGQLEEAAKVMDEMELKGWNLDKRTRTCLILELCINGELDQAIKCFIKMWEKKIGVDADLLNVLVDMLCSERRVDDAYTLVIDSVDKANLTPLISTYKHVIKNLLAEKKIEEAMVLLRLTMKQNLQPFRAPYVDYLSKFGTVNDVSEYLKALSIKQSPPSSNYLEILQSFCKEGRQSEAEELVDKCPDHIRTHANILKYFASLKLDKFLG